MIQTRNGEELHFTVVEVNGKTRGRYPLLRERTKKTMKCSPRSAGSASFRGISRPSRKGSRNSGRNWRKNRNRSNPGTLDFPRRPDKGGRLMTKCFKEGKRFGGEQPALDLRYRSWRHPPARTLLNRWCCGLRARSLASTKRFQTRLRTQVR